jgi:hypothetical protein
MFTLNVCISMICCAIFWIPYKTTRLINPQVVLFHDICILIDYTHVACTIQVPLSLIVISVHRFYSIVYHTKLFFKSKQWVIICIASQWIFGLLVALPMIAPKGPVRIVCAGFFIRILSDTRKTGHVNCYYFHRMLETVFKLKMRNLYHRCKC